MAIIEVHNLTKRFGGVTAVDHLSFQVAAGGVTAFLGPNGAGKTTTLRILLGLVRPSSGTATIAGRPYGELDRPTHRVGAVLESSGFHPGRRAIDHLRVLATAACLPLERVDAVLARVGLAEAADRRVGGFSLGMRQRLGLAGALIGQPEVLILDEPANGLDPAGVHWLRRFLRSFADDGGMVLVSSHLLGEVAQLADDVVIVAQGCLVRQGPLGTFTDSARRSIRVRTPHVEVLRSALLGKGIPTQVVASDVVVADSSTPEAVGWAAAESGVVVYELTSERSNLEDVFLALTAPEGGES
jgi:ABC-2 type transport system ATP-binding protein